MNRLQIRVNGAVVATHDEVEQALILAVATLMKHAGCVGPFEMAGVSPDNARSVFSIEAVEPEAVPAERGE